MFQTMRVFKNQSIRIIQHRIKKVKKLPNKTGSRSRTPGSLKKIKNIIIIIYIKNKMENTKMI